MHAIRPVIIAYDVSDDKKRYRVFKILKQWRLGGQKSVCECRLRPGSDLDQRAESDAGVSGETIVNWPF